MEMKMGRWGAVKCLGLGVGSLNHSICDIVLPSIHIVKLVHFSNFWRISWKMVKGYNDHYCWCKDHIKLKRYHKAVLLMVCNIAHKGLIQPEILKGLLRCGKYLTQTYIFSQYILSHHPSFTSNKTPFFFTLHPPSIYICHLGLIYSLPSCKQWNKSEKQTTQDPQTPADPRTPV